MQSLVEILSSPSWWITAVAAGIISNIAAYYLKAMVGAGFLRTFEWARKRSEHARKQDADYVDRLQNDEIFRLQHIIEFTNAKLWSLTFLVFACTALICFAIMQGRLEYPNLPAIGMMAISALCHLVFLIWMFEAFKLHRYTCRISPPTKPKNVV